MGGTISTGVGLVSGLDIQSIVSQLMAIERRPIDLLQSQIKTLQDEKTAYMAISAQLLALKTKVTPFKSGVTFRPNSASSSNETILSATANSEATPGTYTFRVLQTAQTHQLVSQGFNDPDRTPIGAGTITIEVGQGRLDPQTPLSLLNNQQGIRRGTIKITDRTGNSATIDLSSAITVSDVLDAINSASNINVTAKVSGDRIVIQDNTGSTTSNLIVEDLYGGHAAEDLGIAKGVADSTLVGDDVLNLTDFTPLKYLNDGNGIRTSGTTSDIRITLRDGSSFDVGLSGLLTTDLSLSILNHGQGVRLGTIRITNKKGDVADLDLTSAQTVGDVLSAINNSGIDVSAAIVGSKLLITDSSGGDGTLKVENIGNSYTATDLGIDTESTGTSISGREIYAVDTIVDVIRAIEESAERNVGTGKIDVQISDDGNALKFIDLTGGSSNFKVESINDSYSAEDLGINFDVSSDTINGKKVLAGLNTVLLRSLNGGAGIATGIIQIQDRAGNVEQFDLTSAQTLQDVIDTINNASTVQVQASLNQSGTGILIEDLTNSTTSNLIITDINSTTASDLKIAIDDAVDYVDSGNNQLQYVSENTLLSDLNGGKGISAGSFTITDSTGSQATVTITENDLETMTVGDLIDKINTLANINVTASINTTGDGILLTDSAGGSGTLTVREVGTSQTAHTLNIYGQAQSSGSGGTINGSFEYKITIGGADTLQTLVDKINDLGGPFSASIINDGSGVNAYRLSIVSSESGKKGQLIVNTGNLPLNLFDLVDPRDAVISFGASTSAIVTSSNSNTFSDIVNGLTLEVHSVSDQPVTVSVTRDIDGVIDKINDFIDDVNSIFSKLSEYTQYNADTQEAGVLLGDFTVDIIENRLRNAIRAEYLSTGDIRSLRDIGISFGANNQLEFDEDKFKEAYQNNAEAIEQLFATEETGFGYVFDDILDDLTDYDGTLTRKTENYDDIIKVHQDRIDYLEDILATKEQRLYNQFYQMEQALAQLQSMQEALLSFTPVMPINYGGTSSLF